MIIQKTRTARKQWQASLFFHEEREPFEMVYGQTLEAVREAAYTVLVMYRPSSFSNKPTPVGTAHSDEMSPIGHATPYSIYRKEECEQESVPDVIHTQHQVRNRRQKNHTTTGKTPSLLLSSDEGTKGFSASPKCWHRYPEMSQQAQQTETHAWSHSFHDEQRAFRYFLAHDLVVEPGPEYTEIALLDSLYASPPPIVSHVGGCLEVSTGTVRITGSIPTMSALEETVCHLHFFRLPITCTLSLREILHDVFPGVGTGLSEQTRSILSKIDDTRWHVRLGTVQLSLYRSEVIDLLTCLDIVAQSYSTLLDEVSTTLDLWKYPHYARNEHIKPGGVTLLAVHRDIWMLMERFAREFASTAGSSHWHLFTSSLLDQSITLSSRTGRIHATFYATPPLPPPHDTYIPLIYAYPFEQLRAFEDSSWQERVGPPASIWTASLVATWLTEIFIPHVMTYYQASHLYASAPRTRWRLSLARWAEPHLWFLYKSTTHIMPTLSLSAFHSLAEEPRVALNEIRDPLEFQPYVADIQRWFASSKATKMSTDNLPAYYASIAAIARETDTKHFLVLTLAERLSELHEGRSKYSWKELGIEALGASYQRFLGMLDQQVTRVREEIYEETFYADLLSQALLQLIEQKPRPWRDELLKELREAIRPLFARARFEQRYSRNH